MPTPQKKDSAAYVSNNSASCCPSGSVAMSSGRLFENPSARKPPMARYGRK